MNELDGIKVTVVCPHQEMRNVLLKIRSWQYSDPLGRDSVESVMPAATLEEALAGAQRCPRRAVLVPIGFSLAEVKDQLCRHRLQKLEVIVRPPRGILSECSRDPDDPPSATMIEPETLARAQDPLPALRKALLRLRVGHRYGLRELSSEQDFDSYFRLRRRVWEQEGFLPEELAESADDWELHFSDRVARPIGAFAADGSLVGCARLVLPLGVEQADAITAISGLLKRRGDDRLQRLFQYPRGEVLPFDVLEAFAGFGSYYRKLILRRQTHAEVSRVIVAPEHRGHGLGEVLVDSLKTLAQRRLHIRTLFLACHRQMEGFYARCGFRALPGLTADRFASVQAPVIAMVCETDRPVRDAGLVH